MKRAAAKKPAPTKRSATRPTPAHAGVEAQISRRIADLGDWRGPTMARLRELIRRADPQLLEERKWVKPSNPHGVPTYSRAGLVLTLEVYKAAVKVTFAHGSKVRDPKRLFNASLLGTRRAIDVHEGEAVDAAAFTALVREAVAVNLSRA